MTELHEEGSPGLDASYVVDAGQAVARYFRRGRPCELAYTPGNGSLYELVFVPVGGSLDSAASWMDHPKARSIASDRPELSHDEDHIVLVGWLGHGIWQVDLRHVWHESYLAEKFSNCTVGDAHAIRLLLLAVADSTGSRALAVVR